jgi:hypothetical protein
MMTSKRFLKPLLAQGDEEAFVVILVGAVVIGLAIAVWISYFPYTCYDRIPPPHRKLQPWQVWLMLIPLFGIIWQFFVYPRLGQSFRSYFRERGRTDLGDCGEQLGLWVAICGTAGLIPYIGGCFSIVALVLLIIFLVKASNLKAQIPMWADRLPRPDRNTWKEGPDSEA